MEVQKAILVIQNGTAMEQLTAGDNGTSGAQLSEG